MLCKVPSRVLLAFGARKDWCLQQPPPSFACVSQLPPRAVWALTKCWEARGEPAPRYFRSSYHRHNPSAGYGLQRRGSLWEHLPVQRLPAHAVKKLVQDAREDCGTR